MGVEDAIQRNGSGVPQNEDVDPEDGKVEGKTGVKDASEWDDDGPVDHPSSPPQERDAQKAEYFLHPGGRSRLMFSSGRLAKSDPSSGVAKCPKKPTTAAITASKNSVSINKNSPLALMCSGIYSTAVIVLTPLDLPRENLSQSKPATTAPNDAPVYRKG